MIRIFMGVPSTGNRSDAQCYALRRIEKKLKGVAELVYPEVCVHRIFHDHARNRIVDDFLSSGCDVLWFLDSDVVPNDDVYKYFTEYYNQWLLAGCPYPVMMTPEGESTPQVVFTVYKNISEKAGMSATNIPKEGTDFVNGIATGCIFIKKQVFNDLKRPYFEFIYDSESRNITRGEDLDFCIRISKLGYKFFIDYSMVCKHYKTVDLLDVNNYAIDFANKAMLSYDQQIRSKLAVAYMQRKFRRNGNSSMPPESVDAKGAAKHSGELSTATSGFTKPEESLA